MKYHNKPVTVEAIQWTGKNVSEMLAFAGSAVHDIYQVPGETYSMIINTPAGKTHVSVGDYIIKGVEDSRVYPCNPDVFEKNYEPAEESDSIDSIEYYKNKLYIRDADESKSHLCNSLNAESGNCFRMASACGKDGLYPVPKKRLETLGYYLERADAVIKYLREEVNRLEEEKQNDKLQ